MFEDITRILLAESHTIADAIAAIDAASPHIALVADKNRRLIGTVTDGDVRRGLLRGVTLNESVTAVMNKRPVTLPSSADRHTILTKLRETHLVHIPIVDEQGRVVGVETLRDLISLKQHDNQIVIMAGGLGSRLSPLTQDTPKPMLKVGAKPLLETIIERFTGQGFKNFLLSVNYKAEVIKEYFGDGRGWDAKVGYIEETEPLGTAGCLTLLESHPRHPFFLMNGDILTSIDFEKMLDFHLQHAGKVTVAVRRQEIVIPYGVIEIDGHSVASITEKPAHRVYINAGIYILDPEIVDLVPRGRRVDMTDLLQMLLDMKVPVNVFPIREYWIDIGHADDLKRAEVDYWRVVSE